MYAFGLTRTPVLRVCDGLLKSPKDPPQGKYPDVEVKPISEADIEAANEKREEPWNEREKEQLQTQVQIISDVGWEAPEAPEGMAWRVTAEDAAEQEGSEES